MRFLSLLCLLLFFSSLSFSQIPNSGFENWVTDADTNSNPVNWQTTNSYPYVTVDPFSPSYQGNYAMRVRNVDLGVVILPGVALLEARYAFSQTPTHFGAWVRSTIMPGDTALILVGLTKGDTVIAATDSCTFKIYSSYATYTYLEFPIRTISNSVPDSMYIMVASGLGQNSQVGTELIVDDMAFIGGGPTNVSAERNLPAAFLLAQNYPNPFNPETVVRYQLSGVSHVKLTVYDLLGRPVAVLVDETLPEGGYKARWNAGGVPSGLYLVHMTAGSFSATRKMILIK